MCPNCQRKNPADARFCTGCGAPIELPCPACGTANVGDSRFCKACGQRLSAPAAAPPAAVRGPDSYTPAHLVERILGSRTALEGERKQVTVLFADLRGSMELLADRDPEEARKLLDPVLELMMEAVHRYEGTVNQVMGDGIMALFGAPLALEDHAVRACYAALRMQERIGRYADELQRSQGVPVQIRVGLNSGEVVVRSIGSDLRMDYTAVGQTTHLAARMEQMARPGSILVTADTIRLVEGLVHARELGPATVRGLETPVVVHELTGASPVRSRLRAAAARGLGRFVGRARELAELERARASAQQGHGQVVAVVGEPGVGKSRLFYEFARDLPGWLVLESVSVSYGKAASYLPVIETLKAYFGVEAGEAPQRIRERVIGRVLALDEQLRDSIPPILSLLDALPPDDPFRSLGLPLQQGRTRGALKQLLLRESLRQPLCVVFEDLHWIDAETQAALDFLVETLPTARVLLLVNYRPEYEDRWAAKSFHTRLRVDPLTSESADELLGALLGHAPLLSPLKALLKERTGGNPLFLEESVRSLVDAGALEGEPGAYRLGRDLGTVQVPATVQALLASRIDRLAPEEKHLLQCAAAIGTEVSLPLLEGVAELPADDLQRALGRLRAAELLYEARLFPDAEYTFRHALVHDVAYQGLLQERRRALHRRIGELMETRHDGRLAELAEAVGTHLERGEVWGRAAQHLLAAAEKSKERLAYAAALALCQRALACATREPGPDTERTRALVLRGDLASLLGDLAQANQNYQEALGMMQEPQLQRWIANKQHLPRTTSRDGATIAFYEHGSGDKTLFLVNPVLYGLASVQPILEPLCQDFRIITMDCRGTGSSAPLVRPYSIRQHMEDARAVIEAAAGPVIGIGISRGGNLLVHMAVSYPNLLEKLVTMGTSLSWDRPQARQAQEVLRRDGIESALRFWTSLTLVEPGQDAMAEQFVRSRLLMPEETWRSFFDPDPEQDIEPLLPRVRVPTLVTWGTADRASPGEDAYTLASRIPGAHLHEFKGRAHIPAITATGEFCDVLRRFIRGEEVVSRAVSSR
jgi:class 3 adenylate cyclase/pimeloyl-ACP methyl ester carboxylesterase